MLASTTNMSRRSNKTSMTASEVWSTLPYAKRLHIYRQTLRTGGMKNAGKLCISKSSIYAMHNLFSVVCSTMCIAKQEGTYEPLRACTNKKRGKTFIKKDEICKHDFPRKALPQQAVLICRGLAKQFKLKVSGRRNMLGTFLGERHETWQSGTTPA